MKRTAALIIATLAIIGLTATTSQARDTTWSCPTCITHR